MLRINLKDDNSNKLSNDDDSDIEVSSMRQNFNDPITLSLFQNPYTS